MTLLQEIHQQAREAREALRLATRARLRQSLAAISPPGTRVLVFGSLTIPFRFDQHSDIDLALEDSDGDARANHLANALEESLQRRVDVVLLDRSRLRAKILRTGERWTL